MYYAKDLNKKVPVGTPLFTRTNPPANTLIGTCCGAGGPCCSSDGGAGSVSSVSFSE